MLKKGTRLYSMWHMKCPRCQEGELWRSPLHKMKLYDMYIHCPVCGMKYERDVGFWYGSMIVAYVFSSVALLAVMLFTLLVLKWQLPAIFAAVGITALLGFAYNARISRSVWLSIIESYNSNWREENAEAEKIRTDALQQQSPDQNQPFS